MHLLSCLYRDLYIMYAMHTHPALHVQLVIFRWFGLGVESATCCLSQLTGPADPPALSLALLILHIGISTGWLLCPPRIRITLCPPLGLSAACQLHFSHDAGGVSRFQFVFGGRSPRNAFSCECSFCSFIARGRVESRGAALRLRR